MVFAALVTGSSALLLRCSVGCTKPISGRVATPPPAPAVVMIKPSPGARDVDPLAPVSVTAELGKLTDVALINDAGQPIAGIMTPDNSAWKPTVPLGYG